MARKSGNVTDPRGGGSSLGDLLRAKGLAPSREEAPPEAPAPPPAKAPKAAEPPAPPAPTGSGPKVVLRRTRAGRGGKTVTLVQGLPGDAAENAKRLKKALGTGASVEDGAVAVQGDQVDRLQAVLRSWGFERIVVGS